MNNSKTQTILLPILEEIHSGRYESDRPWLKHNIAIIPIHFKKDLFHYDYILETPHWKAYVWLLGKLVDACLKDDPKNAPENCSKDIFEVILNIERVGKTEGWTAEESIKSVIYTIMSVT